MKNTTKLFAVGLLGLASTAATAHASSTEPSFVDRFREMQALSSTSPYAFKAAPDLARGQGYSLAPADSFGKKSFANRFAQMQAISSNSGEFRLRNSQPDGDRLRVAAAPPVDAAGVDTRRARE